MLENRMVDMLLFETKLPFPYSCRSTWPHWNTTYCQWGRCDTKDITNMNAIAGDRVPTHSKQLRENGNSMKIREFAGNLPSSPGNLWKLQNLRELSGNGYGRFKCCFWECCVVFHSFWPTVSRQNHWKSKPFTKSPRVNICNIYLPMVNCWMACIYPNNGVHFHFMKILIWFVMLCYGPKINWCH